MGVAERRRVKRSRAEWADLFERFGTSGLSGAAFCQREGICKSSFARGKRSLKAQPRQEAGEFVEWAPAAATTTMAPGELELTLPGGVRLRFRP